MPPKAGSTGGEAGDPRFKFVFSVLKNLEQVKPDWEKVAEENGIGYGKNAATKFKGIAKDLGYNYEKNTIRPLGDTETKTAAATKSSSTSRKRKNKDDGENEAKTPSKRKQPAPVKVKDEDDDVTEDDSANADIKDEE
ncbi:hypothetical protein PV05_10247 [Exophiala xenobiotica]|uniref:Myb-like DNA-binding domain-containing protein n=1 Tax=Exophiala xenobiotica TaxID=348802 RepID=A0A0D2CNU5_9EURO|nr:uncharacterized protein PV05_10247 [Exophiala xenobiotica]KIW51537.1 hypothetical protein PV05_10247 [Exophiala xenobiotica]